MADRKISELTSLTSADATDVLPIVDSSVSLTKKVSVSALVDSRLPVKATSAEIVTGTNDTKFLTPKGASDAGIGLTVPTKATSAEINTGTNDAKFATPYAIANSNIAVISDIPTSASPTEVNTGTSLAKFVTPDALAGGNIGIRYIQIICFDFTTDNAIGNGKGYIVIPSGLNGMNLVSVHAKVITAGTTGTEDIQIANVTGVVDMLSTKLTIDSGETASDTAATPAVIDTTHDNVATNDILRIDVDAVQSSVAQGLIVTLGFQLP